MKTIDKLRQIKIRRHKEPFRPVCKEADLEQMLAVNQSLNSSTDSKSLNHICLKFAFYTGVRISELVNLKLEHLDLSSDQVLIKHGKGGKNRKIGVNKGLKKDLEEYISYRSTINTDHGYLFSLPNGKRLTRDRLEKRIAYLAKKAGKPSGLHVWRRACFTHYANKGVPISSLQLIAGHSSITTTQNYIRPDIEDVVRGQVDW